MEQQRQHVVRQMNITLRLARHYHAKPCPETGIQVKYDIKDFREDTRKLENGTQEKRHKHSKHKPGKG